MAYSVPTLVDYLAEMYNQRNTPAMEIVMPRTYTSDVAGFIAFAKDLLAANPPITTFPAAEGLGLTLQDGARVTFVSGAQHFGEGAMQESGAVAITTGESPTGGTIPGNAISM